MQQRRVRLGDILDDYCPRERRVTNHVVVAMIEDAVKQTRCSTCDADHEYKDARVPAQRRRKSGGALADAEGDGRPGLVAVGAAATEEAGAAAAEEAVPDSPEPPAPIAIAVQAAAAEPEPQPEEIPEAAAADDVWVHRPLIRATLPRPEGHVPERKEPDFTMRSAGSNRTGQRHNRGFRPQRQEQGQFGNPRGHSAGGGGQQGERNGNRAPQPGQRSGRPGGQGQGPRQGGGQGRGPKRGR